MRYLVGFLLAIGLLIILIIMLVSGGNKGQVPQTAKTLDSYAATDAAASMVIDGPINAAGEHQIIRITVDRENVTYEELRGYDGSVTEMHKFSNSENAYDVFLHALRHAGFTQGDTSSKAGDEKGYCPLGERYIFQLVQGDESIERFWATSCGNPKTYHGNLGVTIALFKAQVPDYDKLSSNVIFQ
jgi:hypothetical protein